MIGVSAYVKIYTNFIEIFWPLSIMKIILNRDGLVNINSDKSG
jgi:hypothetical protein